MEQPIPKKQKTAENEGNYKLMLRGGDSPWDACLFAKRKKKGGSKKTRSSPAPELFLRATPDVGRGRRPGRVRGDLRKPLYQRIDVEQQTDPLQFNPYQQGVFFR